jgi:hypothetical protein
MDLGHWKLPPTESQDVPQNALGFIYVITNKITNKKYIGKKLLVNKKKRKPLKGRVNSRRYLVESDWQTYTGSSPILNGDIEKYGKDSFDFQILSFQPSKLMLAYHETKTIIDTNAIFSNEYYNEVLNCRFRNKKLI